MNRIVAKDTFYLTRTPGASEEVLDLVEYSIDLTDKNQVVLAIQLHKLGVGDLGCNLSSLLNVSVTVSASMQDQRRNVNSGQNFADIDLGVGTAECEGCARACSET